MILMDPSTGNGLPGRRVDLQEILDNLDRPGRLIDVTGGGSLQLVLPVETTFLPGLPDIPDGGPVDPDKTITVQIPDLAEPSTFDVILGPGLTEVGNFANIDAASIVGVLGQLTFWLDEFRRSDTFANLDLPLVGPALDEALQLADAFRDLVLIDDNDTLLDNDKTLLNDLNAALADAGLGRKLFAANVGGKIALVGARRQHHVLHGRRRPPRMGSAARRTAAYRRASSSPRRSPTAPSATPDGKLAADLSFTVTIGSKTYDGRDPAVRDRQQREDR